MVSDVPLLLCDSSSSISTFVKPKCGVYNFKRSGLVRKLSNMLLHAPPVCALRYVRSKLNLADHDSREPVVKFEWYRVPSKVERRALANPPI